MDHPLATLGGIEFMLHHFLATGAMCPACHCGTRVVSKRWAKCKPCGQRVARIPTPTKEG